MRIIVIFGHEVSGSTLLLGGMFSVPGGIGFYGASIQTLVISYIEGLYVLCVVAPGSWAYSISW